jgi:tetratricopeptide (TPR) repeat protein
VTTKADEDAVYTLRSIQEMLGLSRQVILGFVEAGFVTPERGPRNTYRFGFRDVVLMRTAQGLRDADIPARRIVRSLKRLREALPGALPLTGLRISAIGDDVVVREAGQPVAVESGQLLFDFAVAPDGAVLAFPGRPATQPDAESWLRQAAALESTDVDAASDAYRRAIELAPAAGGGYLGLGALLHEARAFGDALAVYDAGLAVRPDDPELQYNRAIVLEDLGRVDDALAGYEACLRGAPDFADAHWNAARLYERRGGAQQALQHFSAFRRLQR